MSKLPTAAMHNWDSTTRRFSVEHATIVRNDHETTPPSKDARSHIPTVQPPPKKDFDTLRTECLKKGELYKDLDFPPSDTSLYFSRHPPYEIVWKRPHEIAASYALKPELFANDGGRYEVLQGELGDSWVVMATACISEYMELIYRTVARGQSFNPDWYAGIFHFYFWRYGEWTEVIIDDYLPTVDNELKFIHSVSPNEFWAALLEKAYAKLVGSYEALKTGFVVDALHDFTGGLVELFDFEEDKPSQEFLSNIMFKALERTAVLGCSINSTALPGKPAPVLSNGLVTGQEYCISDLREIQVISGESQHPICLIRLRNPCGTKAAWMGPWSEQSEELSGIAVADKEAMGLTCRNEAEFWMDMREFLRNFDVLTLCHLPGDLVPAQGGASWAVHSFHARWKRGVTAGGRPIFKATHWINPQFSISLQQSDDEDSSACTVLIEQEQKDRRQLRQKAMPAVDHGFVIYKRPKNFPIPLPKYFFDQHSFVARCDFFTNARQIIKRLTLEPGDYVIVPSTYLPDFEADFMLRIFTENGNRAECLEDPNDIFDPMPSPSDPNLREKEQHFQRYFYDIAGENMEINVFQFRHVLNMGLNTGRGTKDLSLDVCHSMLSLVECKSGRSGKITYHEFLYLWNIIKSWKRTFYNHLTANTAFIDAYELRTVILSLGYRLNSTLLSKLVTRFANEKYQIEIDSFIACMVKILTLFNEFRKHEKNNKAVFSMDEWLELALVL